MAAPAQGPIGTLINGRYQVTGALGAGAQGAVLAVRDADGAELVLKAVGVATGPDTARALMAEFGHLAHISDPALPRVRDLGVVESGPLPVGTVFFTAERIVGEALLAAVAAAGAAERARLIWSVARDVAGALATLHAAGLLHHDVSPGNVLVVGRGVEARAVLIDLGLAGPAPLDDGAARGTIAYLAPEALAGGAEPRSDLHALGATLHHAAAGAPPFAGADLGAQIRAILSQPAPPLLGLPAPLAGLIARLLAKAPADRPSSAVVLVGELDDVAAAIAPPVRPRPPVAVRATVSPPALVGADRLIAALAGGLDDAATARPRPASWLSGPHGARAGEIVAAAVRRHQLGRAADGAAPVRVVAGDLDEVSRALGVVAGALPLGALVAAIAAAPPIAVLIDVTADDRAAELARLLAAAGPRGAAVIAWQETDGAPPTAPGLTLLRIEPAGVAEIAALAAEMLGRAVPAAWAASLHRVSSGLPGLAAEIVRTAAAAGDPLARDPAMVATDAGAVADAVAARVDELAPELRDVVRAVALWDGRAGAAIALATAAGTADGLGRAIAAGLLQRDGDTVSMPPRLAAAIAARVPTAEAGALHRRAAAAARAAGLDDVAVAPHLAAAGDPDAAPVAARAAAALLGRGQLRRARALAEIAAADPDPRRAARARVLAARAATGLGDYPAARRDALAAADALPAAEAAQARLVAARAAQRAGDLDTADRELAGLAALPLDGALAAEVRGARGRLLVARGRHREALAVVEGVAGAGPGGRACTEAAGLARFYLGDLVAADAQFAALAREAVVDDDRALAGRAAALAAMVALQRGDLASAAALQRQAGDAARVAGDFHAAAVADLNLATALAERGRHGDALPVLARAIAALDALGARGERAAAEFNRGNSLLLVGDIDGAEAAARAALALTADASADVAVFARLLLGDIAGRRGDRDAAAAAYDGALADASGGHARFCALAARAELALGDGAPEVARRLAGEAAALAGSPDDRARLAALRADAARRDGAGVAAAAADAERAARDALAAGRAERAWRTLVAAAEASAAAGTGDPAGLAREAAELRRALIAATPEAWRGRLDDEPDARRLAALLPRAAARPARSRGSMSTDAALEIARLRRLLALSRRLNSEHSLDRLLDDVIDAAIELTEAERGFLLLRGAPGQPLEVVVARNFAAGSLDDAAGKVSRSIAERAATAGEPVITVDAGVDERFGAATSVASLRLRSVMAVPLRQKGRITGCIYVDHRLRDGAFDDHAAGLALDLADIAAIAIENAQLGADLRRRTDENDSLASRLAAELADRDAELTAVRAQLPGRAALRGSYTAILGESPAIVAMLDLVDRAARTELPVVVVGESGTGKELIARALHDHGSRKDQPFVAINCSAMPEPLLESELFGHVRGAFTGADRDRRGLFEVADGGTLFLDEVADTTPGMQAKLLRVVQDGQVRRVGDDRTRRVDVRLIAASQRPLAELVTAGRFREDLRFRLEVIQVVAPPLRERLEDVPALVAHFLDRLAGKLAGGVRPAITGAALRALAHHAWPGNVRELENAIARACALGGVVIDIEDLPEAVARSRWAPPASAGPGPDLALKPALEALERAFVDAAMTRSSGNQTVAARLLGLSRFGLQKKLRRRVNDG